MRVLSQGFLEEKYICKWLEEIFNEETGAAFRQVILEVWQWQERDTQENAMAKYKTRCV